MALMLNQGGIKDSLVPRLWLLLMGQSQELRENEETLSLILSMWYHLRLSLVC